MKFVLIGTLLLYCVPVTAATCMEEMLRAGYTEDRFSIHEQNTIVLRPDEGKMIYTCLLYNDLKAPKCDIICPFGSLGVPTSDDKPVKIEVNEIKTWNLINSGEI